MSDEDRQAVIVAALKRAKQAIDTMCDDYEFIELDGEKADPVVLADEIIHAIELAQAERPIVHVNAPLPKLIHTLCERAVIYDLRSGAGLVELRSWERDRICMGYAMLMQALTPFAKIDTPPGYSDNLNVSVDITGTPEMAEAWQHAWDRGERDGELPGWKRPDITRGLNFPIQSLSIDGITIGDIRYASSVIDNLTSETQQENVHGKAA